MAAAGRGGGGQLDEEVVGVADAYVSVGVLVVGRRWQRLVGGAGGVGVQVERVDACVRVGRRGCGPRGLALGKFSFAESFTVVELWAWDSQTTWCKFHYVSHYGGWIDLICDLDPFCTRAIAR